MTVRRPQIPPTRSPPPSPDCAADGCRARRGRAVTGPATRMHHGEPGWMRGGPHHGGMGGPPPWVAGPRLGGPARLRLLEALAAASGPLSVSEIGDAVGVDQPRASRLVQQAVEMGLVRREADPDDARRTRVALTDKGLRSCAGSAASAASAIDSALARVHRRRARGARAPAHQARRRAGRGEPAARPTAGRSAGQKLVTRSPSTALTLVGSVAS